MFVYAENLTLKKLQKILDDPLSGYIIECVNMDPNTIFEDTLVISRPDVQIMGLKCRLPLIANIYKRSYPLVTIIGDNVSLLNFELRGNGMLLQRDHDKKEGDDTKVTHDLFPNQEEEIIEDTFWEELEEKIPVKKEEKEESPLMVIYGRHFNISRGIIRDTDLDGLAIRIQENSPKKSRLEYGIIDNILGYDCSRSIVSIDGNPKKKQIDRYDCGIGKITLLNIGSYSDVDAKYQIDESELCKKADKSSRAKCWSSRSGGTIKLMDGVYDIVIRSVYAENCDYAVELTASSGGHINKHIMIDRVMAKKCNHVVKTKDMLGYTQDVRIENVEGICCKNIVNIDNVNDLVLHNIVINMQNIQNSDHLRRIPLIEISNSEGITIKDVSVLDVVIDTLISITNSNSVLVDSVLLYRDISKEVNKDREGREGREGREVKEGREGREAEIVTKVKTAFEYIASNKRQNRGLIATNVRLPGSVIILTKNDKKATLNNYSIIKNSSITKDGIRGVDAIISK